MGFAQFWQGNVDYGHLCMGLWGFSELMKKSRSIYFKIKILHLSKYTTKEVKGLSNQMGENIFKMKLPKNWWSEYIKNSCNQRE